MFVMKTGHEHHAMLKRAITLYKPESSRLCFVLHASVLHLYQGVNIFEFIFGCWLSAVPCRAVAQAGSRRLPTLAARVTAQVKSCGICGRQNGKGQVYSGYFGFPYYSFMGLIGLQSSSVIQVWYNRPINGHGNTGLGSTPAPQINTKQIDVEYNG
jgi:hypothetical protein